MLREWMRDHDLEKILWRVICVLIVMFAFNLKIVDLSWDQSEKILEYKRKNYTKELTEYELNEFIKLYPKFKHDIIFQNVDIDKLAEYPDSAGWMAKRWFIYQAWDIDRFFYIQRRAQEAMGIIKTRKESLGLVSQLEKRVNKHAEEERKKPKPYGWDETKQEKKYDISEHMLGIQQQRAGNIGDFTIEELNLVEKKIDQLRELFN